MQTSVHRLVYYSRNRLEADEAEATASIYGILAASRRNNAKVGVTGALLFNKGYFGQVLEGPRAAVAQTFERIQQDQRHSDCLVLGFSQAPVRSFHSWSMAFVGGSVEQALRYGGVAGQSGYDPSQMTGEALFATLHRLLVSDAVAA
jgi:hypothetical protein